jgi:glycosyltransferase involved in cell wall biosynthesis
MGSDKIIINGHFRTQRVTGVQRYAREIISQFDEQHVAYSWLQPPRKLHSDALRQLWMQAVMPFKIPNDALLWSPTNIGPARCENQMITLHDITDQLYPQWFDKKYVAWRRFILPKLLRRVRGIITVSNFSQETILEHFPQVRGKVEVIYNGVRTNHFYPRGDREIERLRDQYNLQKPFVLSVGSLDPRKNSHRLIQAWKRLPAHIQNETDLVITGESAQKFVFNIDRTSYKNVRFTGYVSDEQLPVLYSAAQLFVYPSLFEGFGLPVLEAMACGTPVITSNTTALKEIAADNALAVNPKEPDAIADAINKLLESRDLREQYRRKGQNYAGKFTWKKTAEETKKVLDKWRG